MENGSLHLTARGVRRSLAHADVAVVAAGWGGGGGFKLCLRLQSRKRASPVCSSGGLYGGACYEDKRQAGRDPPPHLWWPPPPSPPGRPLPADAHGTAVLEDRGYNTRSTAAGQAPHWSCCAYVTCRPRRCSPLRQTRALAREGSKCAVTCVSVWMYCIDRSRTAPYPRKAGDPLMPPPLAPPKKQVCASSKSIGPGPAPRHPSPPPPAPPPTLPSETNIRRSCSGILGPMRQTCPEGWSPPRPPPTPECPQGWCM